MAEISDKQLSVIRLIENNLGIKFKGKTKQEAHLFIGRYLNLSRQEALEDECNSYGLPNQ